MKQPNKHQRARALRSKKSKIEIMIEPYEKRGVFPAQTTILEAAKLMGIRIESVCGGKGVCGKCVVRIQTGNHVTNPPTKSEKGHIAVDDLNNSLRLACQVKPTSNLTVFVPLSSMVRHHKLQTESIDVRVKLDPTVKKYFLELCKPTLADCKSDEELVIDALKKHISPQNFSMQYESLKTLSKMLRQSDWKVTVVLQRNEIIALEPGDTTDECFGFAVDVGTTKLAGFLVDLNEGKVVSLASRLNPQIQYGEDVLSRIGYVIMHDLKGQLELHSSLLSGINEMIDECCRKSGVTNEKIYELSLVGNTAMQMLFLNLWPQYTALSPYPPVIRRGIEVSANKLGLKSNHHGYAFFAPIIGGFVGADSVADLMAIEMIDSEEILMDIDIGTNTEIAVGNKDLVMIVSCASGPAFEGMHTKHGIRAGNGAIDHVQIDADSFEPRYSTIDNARPIGICGSGFVDTLAELLKTGLVDSQGLLKKEECKETSRLIKTPEGWMEYVIAWKNETECGFNISISQRDIRELQKAKAAIRAGSEILLSKMNLTREEISTLYVAGAFGNYLDPENARTIGMYPEILLSKIKFVGNTAGAGARMCLMSKEMREYAERISEKVKYYELATDINFQRQYIDATYLPHKNLKIQPITARMLQKIEKHQ